jgi:hypothetical protein
MDMHFLKNNLMNRLLILMALAFIIGFLSSCDGLPGTGSDNADLSVIQKSPATSLTIGWYLPLDYLQKIVGPDFKPKVAKDDSVGLMKLVISSGDRYDVKGSNKGPFRSAILQVEVEKVKGLFKKTPKGNFDNYYICPVTIVSGSLPMAQMYHDNGFVHEVSHVTLDITEKDNRINVEAKIKSGENSILVKCFFEDLPVDEKQMSMTVNQTRPMYKYFYGDMSCNRYSNGKGRIDAEGTTLLTSLGIQYIPYFFVLDRNATWSYSFGE